MGARGHRPSKRFRPCTSPTPPTFRLRIWTSCCAGPSGWISKVFGPNWSPEAEAATALSRTRCSRRCSKPPVSASPGSPRACVRDRRRSVRGATCCSRSMWMDRNGFADVGFGAEVFLHPIPLDARPRRAAIQLEVSGEHRRRRVRFRQSLRPEGWLDLYAFTLEEQHPVDYEVSNYFTSTHPESIFLKILIAQRPGPDKRWTLTNRHGFDRIHAGQAARKSRCPTTTRCLAC